MMKKAGGGLGWLGKMCTMWRRARACVRVRARVCARTRAYIFSTIYNLMLCFFHATCFHHYQPFLLSVLKLTFLSKCYFIIIHLSRDWLPYIFSIFSRVSSTILHGFIIPNFWGYKALPPSFIFLRKLICQYMYVYLQQLLLLSFILIYHIFERALLYQSMLLGGGGCCMPNFSFIILHCSVIPYY